MRALYVWDVTERLGCEYKPMVDDMVRTATIQVVVQVLLSLVDGENNPFFSGVFWLVLLYLLLGIMSYHLLIGKLVVLR